MIRPRGLKVHERSHAPSSLEPRSKPSLPVCVSRADPPDFREAATAYFPGRHPFFAVPAVLRRQRPRALPPIRSGSLVPRRGRNDERNDEEREKECHGRPAPGRIDPGRARPRPDRRASERRRPRQILGCSGPELARDPTGARIDLGGLQRLHRSGRTAHTPIGRSSRSFGKLGFLGLHRPERIAIRDRGGTCLPCCLRRVLTLCDNA